MAKRIWLGLLVAFLAIQFLRPHKNLASSASSPDDFATRFAPPPAIREVFEHACDDCHSNTTRYPWYAEIQPVGWWLADHIEDGKHALNFSEFGRYTAQKQARKLNAISDQLTDREMPLKSYLWIHRDAQLTDAQIAAVTEWCDTLHDRIAPEE